jgi:exonuclease III
MGPARKGQKMSLVAKFTNGSGRRLPTTMNILSWNCQGLGNLRTIREFCYVVKHKRPVMVFLMETKLKGEKMEPIRYKMGFPNMFVVDCFGRSGEMTLLWGENINVEIQNFSQHHINGMIEDRFSGVPWKFTGFYGHPVP